MSYTKGPWHVVGSDNATPHIQHEYGEDWTDIDDLSSRVCVMPAEIMDSYNSWANARLIAAAPELLEELEEFRQAFVIAVGDASPFAKFALGKVDAVIAKAKGEAK